MNRTEPANREEYYMARLEGFAFFMGVFSIPSFFFLSFAGPFLFGSMAIVFAILSKGGRLKLSPRGRRALMLGLAAIILAAAFLVFAYRTLLTMLADPASRQRLSDFLYQRYGLTLDELMPVLQTLPFIQ